MSGAKTRVEKLIEKRDKQWQTTTDTIIEELQAVVIPAIREFVTKIRNEEAADRVKIVGADLNEDNDILLVWGRSVFSPGDEVMGDKGKMIVLTEKQAEFLSMPIQITIPVEMLRQNDSNAIIESLMEAFEHSRQLIEQQQEILATQENTVGDQMQDLYYNGNIESQDVPELDMDLSDFSEEEQVMIREMHRKTGNTIQ